MRKTPLFAARYYLHYLHSFTFIHIPSLQTSNIFCFFQSLHNFSLTQFSSCLSSIQFSSANSFCTVAAQSKSSFMLVLCSRQIPAKANKLILSYLILSIYYVVPPSQVHHSSSNTSLSPSISVHSSVINIQYLHIIYDPPYIHYT